MKKDVYTVNENVSLIEALKLISEKKVSGMPVTDDNDRFTGFISDGDIIRFLSDSYPSFVNIYSFITIDFDSRLKEIVHTKVKNIARKTVITVNTDDDISDVCSRLSKKHIKKAPVIKDGAMVGIINVSNITKYVLKDLTENIA